MKQRINKVLNLWQGYNLTQLEKDVLTELTLKEFSKFKHERCHPMQLMEKTLTLFGKKYKGDQNEYITRCKRKGE